MERATIISRVPEVGAEAVEAQAGVEAEAVSRMVEVAGVSSRWSKNRAFLRAMDSLSALLSFKNLIPHIDRCVKFCSNPSSPDDP